MTDLQKEIDRYIERIPDFPQAGIQYKDISPVFLHPELCTKVLDEFASFSRGKVDAVCGIESRGFLFGVQIARAIDVPFIFVRKAGKLPPPIVFKEYALEYGTAIIELREGHLKAGQHVLVHDDVLATGGTAAACAELVEKCGAKVEQFSFLVNLSSFNGIDILKQYTSNIHVMLEY